MNSNCLAQTSSPKNDVLAGRQRLACDLRDDQSQFPTDIARQMKSMRRMLAVRNTDAARERLYVAHTLILAELRRLNDIIEELNNPHAPPDDETVQWDTQLLDPGQRLELESGVMATPSTEDTALDLPDWLAEELYLLICEDISGCVIP